MRETRATQRSQNFLWLIIASLAAVSSNGCSTRNAGTELTSPAVTTNGTSVAATSTGIPSTTEAATTTTQDSAAEAFEFFDAFAERSKVGFDTMRRLASPGSPADGYTYHQERLFIADKQVGTQAAPQRAVVEGEVIVLCGDVGCFDDTRFSGFRFDKAGLIYSFDVEGRSLADNLRVLRDSSPYSSCWSTNDRCASDESIDITIRSIYRTSVGDVTVTFDWVRGRNAKGALRYDQTTINGVIQPTTYLKIGGVTVICDSWATPVPEPGAFTVGVFSFPAPPEGDAQLTILMRWDGDLLDYTFPVFGV